MYVRKLWFLFTKHESSGASRDSVWPYEVPITTVDETERTVTYMLKDGLASNDVYVTSTSTTKESWKYLSL